MNEVSYGAPQPDAASNAVHELGGTLAAQTPYSDPSATEALAKNFLTRVQRDIDEQVDLRVQHQLSANNRSGKPITSEELGLALGSLGIGVPLSAIAAFGGGHLAGLIIVWAGIVIINVAWARRR